MKWGSLVPAFDFKYGLNFTSVIFNPLLNIHVWSRNTLSVTLGIGWLNSYNAKIDFVINALYLLSKGNFVKTPFNVDTRCLIKPETPHNSHMISCTVKNPTCPTENTFDLILQMNIFNKLTTKVNNISILTQTQTYSFYNLLTNFQGIFNKLPGKIDKYTRVIVKETPLYDNLPLETCCR